MSRHTVIARDVAQENLNDQRERSTLIVTIYLSQTDKRDDSLLLSIGPQKVQGNTNSCVKAQEIESDEKSPDELQYPSAFHFLLFFRRNEKKTDLLIFFTTTRWI